MVGIRYIVLDIAQAVQFYRDVLGFKVVMHAPAGFAALERGELQLYLNAPGAGGAGHAGGSPEPGGWNRFQLIVDDIEAAAQRTAAAGARFRGTIVRGRGGSQLLLEDPSGNLIELFQTAAPEA